MTPLQRMEVSEKKKSGCLLYKASFLPVKLRRVLACDTWNRSARRIMTF